MPVSVRLRMAAVMAVGGTQGRPPSWARRSPGLKKSGLKLAVLLASEPRFCFNGEPRNRVPQVRFLLAIRPCVTHGLIWAIACHDKNFGAKVASENNPTLRRRELGFLLRQLRTERGLSIDDVTERAMFSATKLSRLETGRVGASPRDIRDLCIVYGITDTAERERLMALAREGKQRAWWQQLDLPYATYVGLEAEAASISDYDPDVVPGLLQVEGYARAIFESGDPPLDPATIEHRIEARIRRQALLTRHDAPPFHCVVDEGALRRLVGGPAVMRAQLARIIEVARPPKVTFQLIPFDVGAHPGLDSNFVILKFDKPMVNDIVYVEGAVGNIYLESAADLERYKRIFSRLQSIALDPEGSAAMATRIAATYEDS
jgi:transcriptional regulator with XRE-family HTH domain